MNRSIVKPGGAASLSIANVLVDGFDDVLPEPFEIDLMKQSPTIQRELTAQVTRKISTYLDASSSRRGEKAAFDQLALMPISHVFVPKKEAFDYRKIALIVPEDLVLYQAIAIMIAKPLEKTRGKFARDRVFSYRFSPLLKKGQLFNPEHNIRTFQRKSAKIATQRNVNYVVKSDIANFYDRINLHRLESTLLTVKDLDHRVVHLINQILLHWARRDSYGIPIGSNASRVLAEAALFNVDKALWEARINFIRFVDDYRIFTKTATEAHAALAMLIELLNREGLFINTRKSSIQRLTKVRPSEMSKAAEKLQTETIKVKEFRIFAGYGGTIPIRFRVPAKKSQERYMGVDLRELIKEIREDDFARPEQLRDLLYGIVIQEKYDEVSSACDLVEMFPQFYPLFVDMLIKNAEHLPRNKKKEVISRLSAKLLGEQFLPEYVRASLIELVGNAEFFSRDSVMKFLRHLTRNTGTYLGRAAFDAAGNLSERADALEVREYFDRSNAWERRRIIRLMKKALPEQEYKAWRRAIRTYIAQDYFALEI